MQEKSRRTNQHRCDWLEKASNPDIWMAHKYTSLTTDSSNTRIPTLKLQQGETKVVAASNEEKSRLLGSTFFPTKHTDGNEEQVQDPEEEVEVAPVANIGTLTREQVSRHLAKLKPYKAPRPDGSANIILTK
jgi:hypothetical protein